MVQLGASQERQESAEEPRGSRDEAGPCPHPIMGSPSPTSVASHKSSVLAQGCIHCCGLALLSSRPGGSCGALPAGPGAAQGPPLATRAAGAVAVLAPAWHSQAWLRLVGRARKEPLGWDRGSQAGHRDSGRACEVWGCGDRGSEGCRTQGQCWAVWAGPCGFGQSGSVAGLGAGHF